MARGVAIADENVEDDALPSCNPADHLGGRLLLKYVREMDAEKYSVLSGVSTYSGVHYVTPTPMACKDLRSGLALPPMEPPGWVLLLLPEKLEHVRGPRRISGGLGLEYVLEDGFTSAAFAKPKWVLEYK
jgi:hypothetical protein